MKMENDSFERLIVALERNTDELITFNELVKPELSQTQTINRKAQELLDARADAELFTRGLQEQLRRKAN
jgi:hypothetical protein